METVYRVRYVRLRESGLGKGVEQVRAGGAAEGGELIYAFVGWIELTAAVAVAADAGDEEITKKAKQTQLFDVVKETRSSRHGCGMRGVWGAVWRIRRRDSFLETPPLPFVVRIYLRDFRVENTAPHVVQCIAHDPVQSRVTDSCPRAGPVSPKNLGAKTDRADPAQWRVDRSSARPEKVFGLTRPETRFRSKRPAVWLLFSFLLVETIFQRNAQKPMTQ